MSGANSSVRWPVRRSPAAATSRDAHLVRRALRLAREPAQVRTAGRTHVGHFLVLAVRGGVPGDHVPVEPQGVAHWVDVRLALGVGVGPIVLDSLQHPETDTRRRGRPAQCPGAKETASGVSLLCSRADMPDQDVRSRSAGGAFTPALRPRATKRNLIVRKVSLLPRRVWSCPSTVKRMAGLSSDGSGIHHAGQTRDATRMSSHCRPTHASASVVADTAAASPHRPGTRRQSGAGLGFSTEMGRAGRQPCAGRLPSARSASTARCRGTALPPRPQISRTPANTWAECASSATTSSSAPTDGQRAVGERPVEGEDQALRAARPGVFDASQDRVAVPRPVRLEERD